MIPGGHGFAIVVQRPTRGIIRGRSPLIEFMSARRADINSLCPKIFSELLTQNDEYDMEQILEDAVESGKI